MKMEGQGCAGLSIFYEEGECMENCEGAVLEAEENFVGMLLLFPERVRECIIAADQLVCGKLRRLFEVILSLDEQGIPVDVFSIVSEVGTEKLESIGGIRYMVDIAVKVPFDANFYDCQYIVSDFDWQRRRE
ncbi:hypothetical protein D1970_18260 [Mesobacillus zeae]|uniref:DNA helicase DnaB-like N-terminal domain-containing protein n=2 Tax=Mesobacillus zeae TaxID=1917180 RepID=A0A398AYJ3_9BACI|nr:hypothetical protein D1970_18260 [Mesobacillus zeae]